ncbi:MAG: selenocysteine-specific translation elongation factor, partial [Gemmatimonadota bacterium]|nr:selenocysteine-specific translation elongation factor [Gemmatimonadota bacterium]
MTTDGAPGDRGLRGIVVGTAGHVDHGKTTLVGALTGVETDRWREERERGLTIDIGFAPLELAPDIETGVVDVPGHEDFLKNMLAGATGIDLLLLVVAADEGPMPQTREHLAIAHLLDVRRGVVALTKRDRVDEEWLALAEEATEELLEENGFGQWPIIPVSSVSGEGIEDLVAALRGAAVDLESRDQADLFRLPVDRVFSVHGTGTVVTGTVWSGTVGIGETVRLLPGTATARVRGLEVHGDSRGGVAAGRRCALALVGVDATDAERGTVVVSDPAWRSVRRLGVRIETLARPGRPIEQSQRLRLYLGTREVMARVATLEADPIAPGASGWAVLTLESPLVARVRDRGVLRFYSPVTTIGGVRVCELDPPLSWADRVEDWGVMIAAPPEEALEACVTLAGPRGLEVTASPLALGLPPSSVGAAAVGIDAMRLGDRWYSVEARSDTMVAVRDAVERLHAADR